MSEQIRLTDSEVTTKVNTAGEPTIVMDVEVPDNEKWLIYDNALAVVKFRDGSNNDISPASDIIFGYITPGEDFAEKLDKTGYGFYARNTANEQYDDEKNAKGRLEIDDGGIVLNEQDRLIVRLDSPDVIDISNCIVEINDVKKGTM